MEVLYAFIGIAIFVSWISLWTNLMLNSDSAVFATVYLIILLSPLALLAL